MTATALPREFLLVAACCRWPLDAQAKAAIGAAAVPALDWPYVLRIVKRQRVAGLVHHALEMAGIDVPAAEAGALAAEAERIVRQNLLLAFESARLQRGFDTAGIAVLMLKGTVLAQLAYGSQAFKHSRDIDLLVPAARAEDALRFLASEGYALSAPADALSKAQRRTVIQYGNELALRRHGREPLVELRWRLTDNMRLLAGIDAFAQPQTVALSGGASLRTLSDENLFAYLCVHAASHAWSRLKWLADLNALLANKGEADLERLYRYAQAVGSGLCAGQALLLCHRLLGLKLPAGLGDEIQADKRLRLLVAFALDAMVGPDAETEIENRPFGSTRVALMQFLLGRGTGYFLAQCRVLSVRVSDVVRYPLPTPLHFLYPILRLPSWLWRRGRRFGHNDPLPAAKERSKA